MITIVCILVSQMRRTAFHRLDAFEAQSPGASCRKKQVATTKMESWQGTGRLLEDTKSLGPPLRKGSSTPDAPTLMGSVRRSVFAYIGGQRSCFGSTTAGRRRVGACVRFLTTQSEVNDVEMRKPWESGGTSRTPGKVKKKSAHLRLSSLGCQQDEAPLHR